MIYSGLRLAFLNSTGNVTAATLPGWAQVPLIVALTSALVAVCVFFFKREASARAQEAAARAKAEEDKQALYERFIAQFLPALNASTEAQKQSATLLSQVLERLR